ncbi:hypothetical protein [Frigoribacterium sp. MEB024]|uniref:hypothetical protein n=1 Tax=Frigoribacterium sp. MEB024 TaxID=1589899 RepID=UPI000A5C2BD7|nr:hypothetical protein [Frigoribacterium sp. MEB024]
MSDPDDAPAPPEDSTERDPTAPARASAPAPTDPSDPAPAPDATDPAPAGLPHGWVRVGERRWWSTWVGATTAFASFAAIQAVQFVFRIAEINFRWDLALLVAVGVTVGIFALITVIRNARAPQPWIDLDSGQLRAGTRRPVPLARVDRAVLTTAPVGNGGRVLVLRLTAKEARVDFILRDRKDATLDPTSTAVLAEALRRTSVAMPTSIHDPTGRFARYNFPGHVDRDDAVALVEHPPAAGDPLPAAW